MNERLAEIEARVRRRHWAALNLDDVAWLLSLVHDLKAEKAELERECVRHAGRISDAYVDGLLRERDAARAATFSHEEIGMLIDAVAVKVDPKRRKYAPLLHRLQELYSGKPRHDAALSVPAVPQKECPDCGGHGWVMVPDAKGDPEQWQCQRCDGKGVLGGEQGSPCVETKEAG